MLWQTLLTKFLTDCKARRLSQKTIRRYHDDNSRLIDFLNSRRIRHTNRTKPEHLRTFFAQLHESEPKRQTTITERNNNHLSPFTTAGIYRSIKTFFRWTEREGYLTSNPMNRLRPPKTPKQIVRRLSEAQLEALLEEIQQTKEPARNLALILLLVDSGLRRGEAITLRTADVHLNEHYIFVKGKGEKEREIPIGEITCEAIARWIHTRPNCNSKFLFVKNSGKPLTGETIRSVLRRIRQRLQLERLYPHLLRHTFSKLYLKRGSIEKLSQILGHSRINTTIETYVQDFDIEDLIADHSKASPVDHLHSRLKHRRS